MNVENYGLSGVETFLPVRLSIYNRTDRFLDRDTSEHNYVQYTDTSNLLMSDIQKKVWSVMDLANMRETVCK